MHDDAPRPFRANVGFIAGRPPWEPRVRDCKLDRQNTVFTYTGSTPGGWWDPKVVLAYSRTELEVPVFLPPALAIPPYTATGTTDSFTGTTGEEWTNSGFSGNVSGECDLVEDLIDGVQVFRATLL